uniref:Uncharacterized protein n=1 Tax=Thermococcus sp. EXT9 TaxID=1197732 RepID=L0BAS5_9EURY|nr:hypothetical protein e9a-7 [Thermococcus sp. EXT9]
MKAQNRCCIVLHLVTPRFFPLHRVATRYTAFLRRPTKSSGNFPSPTKSSGNLRELARTYQVLTALLHSPTIPGDTAIFLC